MRQIDTELRDVPRKFEPDELFFSTTDSKGIITSCNDIFVRISGYESHQLIGKPHNIIRHPHMPRCVFKLLWDYLLSTRAIGAYVKNLASSGEYYWVYALAAPIDGGFLSVRLKPTTPILAVVESLYKELLQIEDSFGKDWRAGMEKAGIVLHEKLKALGFESYDEFMSEALRQELESHRALSTAEPEPNGRDSLECRIRTVFSSIESMSALRNSLRSERGFLQTFQEELSLHALNAGVKASHLAEAGRALSVISTEISALSRRISSDAAGLSTALDALSKALSITSFNVSMVSLQQEVIEYFAESQRARTISNEEQIRRYGREIAKIQETLSCACESAIRNAAQGILDLRRSLASFHDIADSLARILLTIQFSYVTGKTLSAGIQGGASFGVLLEELITLANTARNSLTDLKDSVSALSNSAKEWDLTTHL